MGSITTIQSQNSANTAVSASHISNGQSSMSQPTQLRLRSLAPIEDKGTHEETKNIMYNNENPDDFPDGGWEANMVLLGAFLGLIADFGICNSLGAIQSYVAVHQFADISSSVTSWVFSTYLACMYFGTIFSGEIFDRFGARLPLIIGSCLICGGLFLTAQCEKIYQFVLCFGVITGAGTSLCMSPLIGVLSHWYLRNRATACSIATIGGLVGSSIFAVMLQRLYSSVGFAWAIRILSFICCVCLVGSIVLVKERKNKANLENASTTEEETPKVKGKKLDSTVDFFKGALDFSVVKDRRFVLLTLGVFLAEITSLTTLTYLSSYALAHGIKESSAYLLITIVNVCGIPSRLVSGWLADKYGRFNVMLATSVAVAICIFGIWLPARGNISVLYAFGILFGLASSAIISLIPACTGQITKAENFGKVYGTLYFFMAFLTLLGMYVSSVVIGEGSLERYRNFVLFEGALAVANIICWLVARYTCVGWKWCKF